MKNIIYYISIFASVITLSSFFPVATGYRVGDKAMDFKLKNVDGKVVSMSDNPSVNGYIVVFHSIVCPVSMAYEDRIMALDQKYADKGFPVIAINPNDPDLSPGDAVDKMRKRSDQKKYSFNYLVDEGQEIAKTYGAGRTPTVYIVTKKGTDFTVAYIGAIDNNPGDGNAASNKFVDTAMSELLAGKPVTTNYTKAIGCGIKWKKH